MHKTVAIRIADAVVWESSPIWMSAKPDDPVPSDEELLELAKRTPWVELFGESEEPDGWRAFNMEIRPYPQSST